MADFVSINYDDLSDLQSIIEVFGNDALKVVNNVLHDNASADIAIKSIEELIPSSGRNWKGKKAAASTTHPLKSDKKELLTLIIHSEPNYNYLYFPDDGSNTEKHQGDQHFMQKGADNALNDIANLCAESIIKFFNTGG